MPDQPKRPVFRGACPQCSGYLQPHHFDTEVSYCPACDYTSGPVAQPKQGPGRPTGWRKHPASEDWITRGQRLPREVHDWLRSAENRKRLIDLARK